MSCPSCNHENRPNAKFCGECGSPLARACSQCGAKLPPSAKFCDECGSPVAAAAPTASPTEPAGARKIVSILFADLVGSTGLHERLDPESARRFMESYYAAAREAVQRHGGTVTQFLGDGVKAVFGIPRVAEDDAIRAVQAGVAMQEAFRALAEKQRVAVGETGLRVAVNTGEVVAKGETEIIGDPVNVAARLQECGRDGDVVIGESTQRLVSSDVSLELLGSFDLKGRAEAVKAYRVVSLDAPGGAAAAAFVGREAELARITAVFEQAVETPATRLAVLLGSPGLGKSRLIGEFARRSRELATVVAAHCDAAGGATFAPLADALRELLEIEAGASADAMQAVVAAAIPSDDDGERSRIATGIVGLLTGTPGAPEEVFFVVRRFLAGLATNHPVVLLIDDLQWAEPLLLDLVEHLVQWGRELPLLVLIGARPELREVRSSLAMQGGLVADVFTLDGLDATAAMRLAAGVIGAADLPTAVAAKVLATSEGNPLFISELVRMLVDEGAITRDGDRWVAGEALATVEMPPTIHALLAARIERLEPLECAILERAAVVGRQFSRSAVAGLLSGDEPELDARIETLQRAELIERDTGWLLGEPVLRFHHVLIRDAAYRRLLKGTRIELHERLANWIEGKVGDASEHDEMIGRHLEEAHRLLGELGPIDAAGQLLGERAATRLAAAGRRALEGDDVPLAAGLLGRAFDRLGADDPGRADLALDWCEALLAAGDVTSAADAIDALGRLVRGSARLRAWHTCFVGQHTVLTAPEDLSQTVVGVAAAAESLASLDDAAGEAKGHFVQALALSRQGQVGACEASLDLALAAARRAGDRRRANTVLALAPLAALWGPSPVTRASGRCLDVVRVLRITQGAPAVEAVALSCQGVLESLRGRTDAAHRMIASGREMVEELGISQRLFEADVFAGFVALLEGDVSSAERNLRGAYDGLRDLGLGIDAARAAALLARAQLAQGRVEEAEALSHESEALAGDDLKAAIAWRGVRAESLAQRGEHVEAIAFARAAVALAAATDALLDHADARKALAVALRAAGRPEEAASEERRARQLWVEKGATLLLERDQQDRRSDSRESGAEPRSERSEPAPDTARSGVRPNAPVLAWRRFDAALARSDYDAIGALFAEDYEEIDHATGSHYGFAEARDSLQRLFRSRNPSYREDPLAMLGESMALRRRRVSASATGGGRFDVGEYRNEAISVLQVDEHGLFRRQEVFPTARLGDAIARLYDGYAEELPEGAARSRAEGTARSVRAWLTPFDIDVWGPSLAPDIEMVDHRTLGTWNARGVVAASEQIRALRDVARGWELRDEDVLALAPDALLVRRMHSGIERVGGGVYERQFLMLGWFGADGQLSACEWFDVGKEAQAIARFEALTASSSGRPTAQRPTRRAVRSNAATRISDGFARTLAARDAEGLESLLADDLQFEHWPTGASYGAREFMITWRSAFEAERLEYDRELIASLGDSLALHRHFVSVDGLRESTMADFGTAQFEELVVIEADRSGRCRRMDLFSPDKMRDAVVRFYDAYAESLPEGPERTQAEAVAHSVAVWTGPIDLDQYAATIMASTRLVDHRVLATWSSRDAEEVLQHFRHQLELAPDFACRVEDAFALEPGGMLLRSTFHGSSRTGGGLFENRICALDTFAADGRLEHIEAFEAEDAAGALARFDALMGARAGHVDSARPVSVPFGESVAASRPFQNTADRFRDRIVDAWNANDWTGLSGLLAEDFRFEDRRPLVQLELDRNGWVEMTRKFASMESATIAGESLATRGDRLVLWRVEMELAEGDVGPSVVEHLNVFETNEAGDLLVAGVRFDPADIAAAYAELDARFEAGEGAPHQMSTTWARNFDEAMRERDWDTMASLYASDCVANDHRLVGWGTMRGALDFLETTRAMVALAPDAQMRMDDRRVSARGVLSSVTWMGKRDGGRFESPFISIVELDDQGRGIRFDFHDVHRADVARARFSEIGLERSIASPRALAEKNTASAAMERWRETYRLGFETGDWQPMRDDCAPGCVFEDRRRMALLVGDVELMIASARDRATIGAYPHVTAVGTAGDRVVVMKVLWSGGPSDGPFEIEYSGVFECDQAGRSSAFVLFDLDDGRAAQREAWARWSAIEPEMTKSLEVIAALADGFNDQDRVRVRALCADDLVYHDRRRTGVGRIDGADAAIASIEEYWKLAGDQRIELGWQWPAYGPHGGVTVVRRSGTLPDGGAFESEYLEIFVVEHGRATHLELFELEDLESALARFEALHPDSLQIPPNTASRLMDRIRGIRMRGDLDALRGWVADDFRFDDRKRGSLVVGGVEEWLRAIEFLSTETGARLETKRIATAGDRLVLDHCKWQESQGEGRFEIENYRLSEVDADGKLRAMLLFDPDDRAAASDELFARYLANGAGDMGHGAFETLRGFNEHDLALARRGLSDDFVLDDHRLVGMGRVEGPDAYIASVAALHELIPNARTEYLHHAAVTKRGRVGLMRTSGLNSEGGEVESYFVLLALYREGKVARFEMFDVERLGEALARLEALNPGTPGLEARPNAASEWFARWESTFQVRDWDAMRAQMTPSMVYEDRRRLFRFTGDLEQSLSSARERAEAGTRPSSHLVGTAGDRIAVLRVLWFGGPADGRFESEVLTLIEVDAAGLLVGVVHFDLEDRRAAQREAWSRWAALDPRVGKVVSPVSSVLDAFNGQDAKGWRDAFTHDVVVEDHRLAGMGRIDGADAYAQSVVELWALAPVTHAEFGWHWLALDDHGCVLVLRRTGTVPDGGDFESEYAYLCIVDRGRISRAEMFEMSALDKALARFEALRPDSLRICPNAAVRTAKEFSRAVLDNDWSAVRSFARADVVFDDRGKRAMMSGDVETLIESVRYLIALPGVQLDAPLIGTVGDRVAVHHEHWFGGPATDAEYQLERIRVIEVDAEGLLASATLFDPEDRPEAFAHAHELFVAGEAAGCGAQILLNEFRDAWGRQDWELLRALMAEDTAIQDHRLLGFGVLDREQLIESWRVQASLAPDVHLELLQLQSWNEFGAVWLNRVCGTRDGGAFESVFWNLFIADEGLLRHHEFFDEGQGERAAARFEELCAARTR